MPATKESHSCACAATPKPEVIKSPRPTWMNLSETQIQLAEIASDMIANGGNEVDMGLLLNACMGHQYRRRVGETDQESVEKYADKNTDRLLPLLAKQWRRPAPESMTVTPNTVAELVAANVRQTTREYLTEFFRVADLQDMWLLKDILSAFEGTDDAHLGDAFANRLANSDVYMKVNQKDQMRVESILLILEDVRKDGRGEGDGDAK